MAKTATPFDPEREITAPLPSDEWSSGMLFIVTFNHDHHEWAEAFATREAACAAVGEAFGIGLAEGPPDSLAFWQAV